MKNWILAFATGISAQACSTDVPTIETNAIVIDVRTEQEWKSGHLEHAKWVPMDQLTRKISSIAPDKSQQVFLYCRSGNRAGQMLSVMQQMGYQNVVNAGSVQSAAKLLNDNVVR